MRPLVLGVRIIYVHILFSFHLPALPKLQESMNIEHTDAFVKKISTHRFMQVRARPLRTIKYTDVLFKADSTTKSEERILAKGDGGHFRCNAAMLQC